MRLLREAWGSPHLEDRSPSPLEVGEALNVRDGSAANGVRLFSEQVGVITIDYAIAESLSSPCTPHALLDDA